MLIPWRYQIRKDSLFSFCEYNLTLEANTADAMRHVWPHDKMGL